MRAFTITSKNDLVFGIPVHLVDLEKNKKVYRVTLGSPALTGEIGYAFFPKDRKTYTFMSEERGLLLGGLAGDDKTFLILIRCLAPKKGAWSFMANNGVTIVGTGYVPEAKHYECGPGIEYLVTLADGAEAKIAIAGISDRNQRYWRLRAENGNLLYESIDFNELTNQTNFVWSANSGNGKI